MTDERLAHEPIPPLLALQSLVFKPICYKSDTSNGLLSALTLPVLARLDMPETWFRKLAAFIERSECDATWMDLRVIAPTSLPQQGTRQVAGPIVVVGAAWGQNHAAEPSWDDEALSDTEGKWELQSEPACSDEEEDEGEGEDDYSDGYCDFDWASSDDVDESDGSEEEAELGWLLEDYNPPCLSS
ncbi:hypothetical protein B0H16DRAFT_1723451 [Mycena metata]|uniref:Uncharacterized protein n=1 Tax=Mycena metata TaxID=1033252 RepID=A0AAD7IY62_9AGAR|nr:hypothetical protein B0H16DRAFT_1723451 [Mycena metata]